MKRAGWLFVVMAALSLPVAAQTPACAEHVAKSEWDAAIAACGSALAADPEDAQAWALRGIAHRSAGRPQEAFVDFDRALGIQPGLVPALGHRAMLHAAQGRAAEAVADLKTALATEPKNPELLQAMGTVQLQAGNNKDGVDYLERAAKLADGPQPWLELAQLPDLDAKQREKYLTQAIKAAPKAPQGYAARGAVRAQEGNDKGALRDLRDAVKTAPDNAGVRAMLAAMLLKTKELREALDVLDAGIAMKPETDLLALRMDARAQAGDPVGALADYQAVESHAGHLANHVSKLTYRSWVQDTPALDEIGKRLVAKYVPDLERATAAVAALKPAERNCTFEPSAASMLEALAVTSGQVKAATERIKARYQTGYESCLAALEPLPTARFAEARPLVAQATANIAAGVARLQTDCGAHEVLAQCADRATRLREAAGSLMAELRKHEEVAASRRVQLPQMKASAAQFASDAADRSGVLLERSARSLFAEHYDESRLLPAIRYVVDNPVPDVEQACPEPRRYASDINKMSAVYDRRSEYASCLQNALNQIARQDGFDAAATELNHQRKVIEALQAYQCSRRPVSGCVPTEAWERANDRLRAESVQVAVDN